MADKTPSEVLAELQKLLGRPDPVQFARALIGPPAAVYVSRDDVLYVRSRNSVAGLVVTVAGRFQRADGDVIPFSETHTPNADRSVAIESIALSEGFLRSAVCFISSGTARRGQTWIELGVLRGVAGAGAVRQVLTKDYVTPGEAIGWPGGPIRSSVEGPGMLLSVAGTDPAAGVEIVETVPADARWRFIGATFQLVAGVAVANRQVHLVFDDGANVLFRTVAASVQTAGQTHNYNAGAHGVTAAVVAGEQFLPTSSELLLFQAWRLRTATDALQAADDYGAPRLLVEEWIED